MRNLIIFTAVVVCIFSFVFIPKIQDSYIFAEDNDDISELEKKIDEAKQKIAGLQNNTRTLTNELAYIDTQMQYAKYRIEESSIKINQKAKELIVLQTDIDSLSEKSERLIRAVDNQEKVLGARVREHYKQQRTSSLASVLSSELSSDLVQSLNYLRVVQTMDSALISKMQSIKTNYQAQQVLLEQKKDKVEQIKKDIEVQKIEAEKLNVELAEQQESKNWLLVQTKSQESEYQKILEKAEAQLISFKSFTAISGFGAIEHNGLGTGYDGSYFSQRDSEWAYHTIGRSTETVYDVGCLLTSVAMVLKGYGVDTNPAKIANDNSYFFSNTAYMLSRSSISMPDGYYSQSISISSIDNELEDGRDVIVGLNVSNGYSTHFVVLKKKDSGKWIMYDPWHGPDLNFSDYYSSGQIFSAEIIR